jgi:hypothetical protein
VALVLWLAGLLISYPVLANAPVEPQPTETPDPCAEQSAAIVAPQPFEHAVFLPLMVN